MQSFHYQVVPMNLFSAPPKAEQTPSTPSEPIAFQGFEQSFHEHVRREEVGEAIVWVASATPKESQPESSSLCHSMVNLNLHDSK
ncbi:hypothetical protein CVT26_006467 [Gymnopilus dilepis]|uniref:Uncharacterized protein n=1 Tax=Gymnopilus dilepis TaxID=231916 RepID=A0A409YTZ7_9AGAR|nr:hypothetical protein CVT26_006467 [Gymnopilus dilepis]